MQRSTPWNWPGIRAASGLVALAALYGLADSARAVTIYNLTSNTTLFSDNFENQAVGSAPTTGNMNPGAPGSSWSSSAAGTRSSRNVVSTPLGSSLPPGAPGPYEGSKYLLINIPRSTSGFAASATANFTPLPAGNTLSISFAYAWGTGGTTNSGDIGNGNGGPQLQLWDSSDTRAIWMDSSDTDFHFYSSDGNTELGTIVGAKGALGTWHNFNLTYTQGTNDLMVTVDGISTTLLGAVADGTLLPNRLQMDTTRAGVVAYDAILSIPGDFNHDGIVDSTDYKAWRRNPEAFAPNAYEVWRANFGVVSYYGAGSGQGQIAHSVVPEPAALWLAATALGAAMRRRRPRNKQRARGRISTHAPQSVEHAGS